MFSRVKPVIAGVLLGAASLGFTLTSVPAHAAPALRPAVDKAEERSEADEHSGEHAGEKPDPAWKERYEMVHEPRERSEQIELAREQRTGGS